MRSIATPALVVCAAGNNALDNDVNPHYPSSYRSENILAVAASTNTEQLASFSHFGATSVDVAAPGEYILSTCVTPNKVTAFSDTMNSLDAWDADAPWGLNTIHYTSAPSAADDSPAGYYSPNANAWLTTRQPIDLEGLQKTELSFNARWDLEDGYDKLHVISSPDGEKYYSHGKPYRLKRREVVYFYRPTQHVRWKSGIRRICS
jgi:subtilisin family serine protease